mgnify:CR=1 FL=1
MNKRILVLIICISMLLFSGCWDATDIEDLSIPIIGGYDLVKDGSEEEFNASSKIAVTGVFPLFSPDVVSSATIGTNIARTIGETRTERALRTPKHQLFGILQAVVYDEELCEQGLYKYLDILHRNPKIKLTLYVAITEGKAVDLLNTKITHYSNIGDYIVDLLRNSSRDSFIPVVTLHSLITNSCSEGKNPIAPIIKPDKNGVSLAGVGIFKADKLIAKAGVDEARTISFLRGEKAEGNIPFTVKDNNEIIDEGSAYVKNSRKVDVYRNANDITFVINIKLEGQLTEHYSKNPIEKKSNLLAKIENSIKLDVENECKNLIEKMQKEYKVDCIDITRYAMAKWRSELKDEIDQGFIENVTIKSNVDVEILTKGELE